MAAAKTASRKFVKTTIKDVAERAGVSMTTVSLFLSGRKSACSPDTAGRITEAIQDLHYVPGPLAGRTRDKATRTIGLCIESADDISDTYDHRNTYHQRLNRAIVREADTEGYALLHYPACVRHGASAEPFLDGRVDGVLFGSPYNDERVAALAAAGLPTVIINRKSCLPDDCGAVFFDEDDTSRVALDYLWELGHRRIAHFAGPIAAPVCAGQELPITAVTKICRSSNPADQWLSDSAIRRCDAYLRYMKERGALDPGLAGTIGSWADASTAGVEEVLGRWLSLPSPPTAIFCANDSLAVAVEAAATQFGIRIPDDLSVVGINNRAAAEEADPPVTSVDIPVEQAGREAMRLLLRMLNGEEIPAHDLRVALPAAALVRRGSTAPCMAAGQRRGQREDVAAM